MASSVSVILVILIGALGVYIATDPLKLSPIRALPDFEAKAVALALYLSPETTITSCSRPHACVSCAMSWALRALHLTPPAGVLTQGLLTDASCGGMGLPWAGHLSPLFTPMGANGGEAKLVVGEAEGVPFHFTNDVEISSDGLVYFTDSSAKYRRRQFFLAAFSGDDSGRLLRYNPSTKEVKVLYKGIQFPNGLAFSKDESFLVVAETTTCRLSRYWLKGEKAGTMETFVHLPGPPDNVRVNKAGEFWVAIHCRQSLPVWSVFSYPWIRQAIMKLPVPIKYIYPFFLGGKPHAMIVRYDSHGNVLEVLEDQTGEMVKLISEVEERDGELWLGSVLMPYVAVYSR